MIKFDLDNISRKSPLTIQNILNNIGDLTLKDILQNFNDEEFDGKKWQVRKNFKYDNPILNKTGRLKNSFRIQNKTNNSITIGSDLEYAAYHDEGTNKLPKREMIGDDTELNNKIIAMIELEMQKLFL